MKPGRMASTGVGGGGEGSWLQLHFDEAVDDLVHRRGLLRGASLFQGREL